MKAKHIDSTLLAIEPGPDSEWSFDNWTIIDDAGRTATVWGEPDDPETEGNAQRLAACWNACYGLDIPEGVPPGALAELVAAARDALTAYDLRGYGIGEEAQALEDALAPFKTSD